MSAQEHVLIPAARGSLEKTFVEAELSLDLDSQPSLSDIPDVGTYKPVIVDTPLPEGR